jgi:dsRNA-specific ribonuclease
MVDGCLLIVRIVEKPISKGTGKSKKEAEQIAAKKAIEIMSKKK